MVQLRSPIVAAVGPNGWLSPIPRVPGASTSTNSLTITFPPVGWLGDDENAVLDGQPGSTGLGQWRAISSTHYIYSTHNDGTGRFVGVDPGDFETALAGMTGIEVQHPAGNRTSVQHATTAQAALNAAGLGLTISRTDDQVELSGSFTSPSQATGGAFSTRGYYGIAGAEDLDAGGSVASNGEGYMAPANLPSGRYRVIGVRVRRGNNITNPVRVAVSTSPIVSTVDADVESAVPQWEAPVEGTSTFGWASYLFAPSDCFEVDPTTTRLYIGTKGDGGTSSIAGGSGAANGLGFQADAGGDNLWVTSGGSGSANAFASPAGAVSTSFNFGIQIQVIVQEAPYYGNGAFRTYMGFTPGRQTLGTGSGSPTTANEIFVGWMFRPPDIPGLQCYDTRINLDAHGADPSDQLRVEYWDNAGTMSLADYNGDTIYQDVGPTSGADTGWVSLGHSAFSMTGGERYRLTIKGGSGTAPTATTLAFNSDSGQVFDKPLWAQGGNMADTEIEVASSAGETVINFDPQVATASPLAPDSVEFFPDNEGGLAILIGHDGFS